MKQENIIQVQFSPEENQFYLLIKKSGWNTENYIGKKRGITTRRNEAV
jgi:hypothetical protein